MLKSLLPVIVIVISFLTGCTNHSAKKKGDKFIYIFLSIC